MNIHNASAERVRTFRRDVWKFYRVHGRDDLPWRHTEDPYKILVCEVMLQQTQVPRVVPKYLDFLEAFPTVSHLAHADTHNVLELWQGLGYNRRALALKRAAAEVTRIHGGSMPVERVDLERLPGVGAYTAGAVRVFAYNKPEVLIETNIRTVMFNEFFENAITVSDRELHSLVEQTLDTRKPREWYWALMDLGAHLKRAGVRVNNMSRHYKKQPTFKGSDRQIRGAIIRTLVQQGSMGQQRLVRTLSFPSERVKEQVRALTREGMLQKKDRKVSL